MSGKRALLDSNVLIFASKQKLDMVKLLADYDTIYTSIITEMEVYGYECKDDEIILISQLFENMEVIEVTREIGKQVITYRKNKTKKIKLPDAIILATARHLEADLITDDWDDFQAIDAEVKIINIEEFKV